jgi:hypothetical protein
MKSSFQSPELFDSSGIDQFAGSLLTVSVRVRSASTAGALRGEGLCDGEAASSSPPPNNNPSPNPKLGSERSLRLPELLRWGSSRCML